MKRLILLLAFFNVLSSGASAQQKAQGTLVKDENGAYIWYEVVAQELAEENFALRAMSFLRKDGFTKVSVADTTVNAEGTFDLYKRGLVSRQPDIKVNFKCTLQWQSGRYRIWLDQFVYAPYKRNRYGQFETQNGIRIPLEETPGKINRKAWEAQVAEIRAAAQHMSSRLKSAMLETSRVAQSPEIVPRVERSKAW